MKLCEYKQRVAWLCEYKLGYLEREALRAKYKEMCEVRARAIEVEAELKAMLARYE